MNTNQHTFIISKLEEIGRAVVKVDNPIAQTYFNAISASFLATAQYHTNEFVILNMILTMRKVCLISINQILEFYHGDVTEVNDEVDLVIVLENVVDDIMKKFIISGTDPNEGLIYDYVTTKSVLKKRNEIRMIKCNP